MSNTIDAQAFVKAFENCDFKEMAKVCHQDLRFKNTGVPAQKGRDKVFKGWQGLVNKVPHTQIKIHRWGSSEDAIFTDRDDIFPITKNFTLSFRVVGVFSIKNDQIVYWQEHFDILSCAKVIIVALIKWPVNKFL